LEALADAAPLTRDLDLLTEHVRQALARSITRQHADSEGRLSLITLAPQIEQKVQGAIQQASQGSYLALDPEDAQGLVGGLSRAVERVVTQGHAPVLLTAPVIRAHVKKLTERFLPNLTVLSPNEITPGVEVQSIETVEVS
jgi:flagellar biosynthesis protein FlhA